MNELDRAVSHLHKRVRAKLKINPGLAAVERHSKYGKTIKMVYEVMRDQVLDLLESDLFDDIDTALGAVKKAEGEVRINSESDELEIVDAVAANLKPLENDHDFVDAFTDFMIIVFNMGGQDFLNKHNIPATFDLQNEAVITHVKNSTRGTIKGVDQTTIEWVKNRIVEGRTAGQSNAMIAHDIKQRVPETYANRSEAIVRTETARMVGESEHETAHRNGASHKEWVTVGDGEVCDICEGNESAGVIGISQSFPSGDLMEPAHPNCRCLVEYVFTPFMGSVWHGQ